MQHKVKLTVIDKKLYPELQAQYCADPESGACPVYEIGDEFVFERYGEADDFWKREWAGSVRKHGTPSPDIFIRDYRADPLCEAG